MMQLPISNTALIVIDVQKAFDEMEAAGIGRNNPDAIERISDLLASFRAAKMPIIHIRHASLNPASRFQQTRSGYAVKDEVRERDGEAVLVKNVNSSFIGTGLDERLRNDGLSHLVIVGATTNHCVETTTRMAGNLGYNAFLVADATWTFDRTGPDGRIHAAQDIHDMSLVNLHDEFCEIVMTADILRALPVSGAS